MLNSLQTPGEDWPFHSVLSGLVGNNQLGKSRVTECLLKAMTVHGDKAGVQETVAGALRNLSSYSVNEDQFLVPWSPLPPLAGATAEFPV